MQKYETHYAETFSQSVKFEFCHQWNTTECVNICPSSSLYTMDSTLMWLQYHIYFMGLDLC